MAIESAGASSLGVSIYPPTRHNEANTEAGQSAPQQTQPTGKAAGVEVALGQFPQTDGMGLLDRVHAVQQARETVNQLQDSLLKQHGLASVAEELPPTERSGLNAQQAELQTARTQEVANNERLQAGNVPALAEAAANLSGQGLIGEAEALPGVAQLNAGIEQLSNVDAALRETENRLQAEFTQSMDERLQSPAGAIANPSEAEAVLARVLEHQNELPRASNAIDDAQRQQTLNLLTI